MSRQPSPPSPPPSFAALHDRYRLDVHRWLRRAHVAEDDLDDLTQNVFVQLFVALAEGRFDGRHPRQWLRLVARRAARDHLQSLPVRAPGEPLSDLFDLEDERALTPEVLLAQHQGWARIQEAIKTLPALRRRVFVLFEIDGLTTTEIAAALGEGVNSVTSYLREARKDFKEAYLRRQAQDRRALLLPLGSPLSLRLRAWIADACSAIGRALLRLKAGAMGLGLGSGLSVALGAAVSPPVALINAPAAAVAPTLAAVSLPPPSPPRPPEPERAARASPVASPGRDPSLEQRSLEAIRALLREDPARALAALARHKRAFVREQHHEERQDLEDLARRRLAATGQAHP